MSWRSEIIKPPLHSQRPSCDACNAADPRGDQKQPQKRKNNISPIRLLPSYWKQLVIAGIAVVGVSAADLLQPWPLKVVLDYVIANRPMPQWFNSLTNVVFGSDRVAILNFAIMAVAIITLVDSISS